MDQQKIGAFLKVLRKQKGLTQEQIAEKFNVSSRTVSRWENGNNMPDLDVLIEISDFYEVDLRELLDGERRSEKVNNENQEKEETVLKAVDYANTETERYTKRVHWLLLTGAIFWFVSSLIDHTVLNSNGVLSAISDFAEGAAIGMIICGIVFTSRYGQRIKAFKQRLKETIINFFLLDKTAYHQRARYIDAEPMNLWDTSQSSAQAVDLFYCFDKRCIACYIFPVKMGRLLSKMAMRHVNSIK